MKFKKTHFGSNQAPGGKCPNLFHYCYPDFEATGLEPQYAEVDDTCPDCGAVKFPGGAVTKTFANEYMRRLSIGICLTSRAGKFLCSNYVPSEVRAKGSCICDRCSNAEMEREGRADGRAYSRTVERDHQ